MSAGRPDSEQAESDYSASFPPTPHGIPVLWVCVTGALVILSLVGSVLDLANFMSEYP